MRFLFRHAHVVACELDDHVLLVSELPKRGFDGMPALEAVRTLSRQRDLFLSWRGHIVANPKWTGEGVWRPVRTPAEVSVALHRAVTFCLAPANTSYDTLQPQRNVEGLDERLRSCGLLPVHEPQKILGELVLAAADGFPQIEGILSHPVFGETHGRWLAPAWPQGHVTWSHMTALLSAFDLPPVDSAIIYTFLLGCLHAASLDYPRPILVVDSQHPGRGKGEIGQVLSVLLDNTQSAIPSVGKGVTDDLIAHLIEGHRVVAVQNVTATADWNNETFCCLATDGNVKKRAKYDRYATAFKGIVGMLSTVYGVASFHEDMISRAWRVYLGGVPCRLSPRPCQYVASHRDDLLREAHHLHAAAQPWNEPPVSRFAEFEAAGAAAYSVLSGLSHPEVRDLLKQGYEGARGLRTGAVCEAWKRWPDEFNSPPSSRVLSRGRNAAQDLVGARVFGKELTS